MIQQGRAIKATEKRATLIRVDAICVADVLSQIRRRKMDSIVRGGTFRFEDATQGGDTPRSDERSRSPGRGRLTILLVPSVRGIISRGRERESGVLSFLRGYDGTAHDKARYRSSRGRSRFAS